jgi:hypothetical protein
VTERNDSSARDFRVQLTHTFGLGLEPFDTLGLELVDSSEYVSGIPVKNLELAAMRK